MTTDLVIDTHAIAWLLPGERSLPAAALDAIRDAAAPAISSVSIYENASMANRKRWDQMHPLVAQFRTLIRNAGCAELPTDGDIAMIAGRGDWKHGDPCDPLIAATALRCGAPLLTADREMQAFERLRTIW